MRIHDPKRFGVYLMLKRKEAKIKLADIAAKLDMDKKLYYAIECGLTGGEVDDEILDVLMDEIPGFRLANAPGAVGPSVSIKDLEDREGPPPKN